MSANPPRLSLVTNGSLRRAVTHQALVEQAKGILILLYRIDAEQAFEVLRSWATATDTSVVTVARTLHAVCLKDDSSEWDREVRAHVEAAVGRLDGIRLPLPPQLRRPRLRSVQ
jgi:hypothetical protein